MSIYIKVNNTEYPAAVSGVYNDRTWDGRGTNGTIILQYLPHELTGHYFTEVTT